MDLFPVSVFSVEPEAINPVNPVSHLPFLKGVTDSVLVVSFSTSWAKQIEGIT
jgi:hypothetical protein